MIVAFALLVLAAGDPDPDFHLYVLAGQSNMAGRGVPDAESGQAPPRVLMLNRERVWVPAVDPVHFDKAVAGVGPAIAFGRRMAEAHLKGRIGLIPCAVGGSSIRAWEPGAEDKATKTHPYDDLLARVREAQKAGVVKGILWHQGESDRTAADEYGTKLTALVARLRKDLGVPEAPFVAGELTPFKPEVEVATKSFNAILHGLEKAIARFAVVATGDLKDKGDRLHFDTPSARTLGLRYAEALLRLR